MNNPLSQSPRASTPDRAIGVWLLVIAAMIALMVVVGGLTRLTGSGLSITEWHPVTGVIPPLSAADWQAEFAKYQGTPQYELLNRGMGLDAFKTIYWWEWTHRLIGRLLGFVFAIPFLYFAVRKRIDGRLAVRLLILFALGGGAGAARLVDGEIGTGAGAHRRQPVSARGASGAGRHPVRIHAVDRVYLSWRTAQRGVVADPIQIARRRSDGARVRADPAGRVDGRARCGPRVLRLADLCGRLDSAGAVRPPNRGGSTISRTMRWCISSTARWVTSSRIFAIVLYVLLRRAGADRPVRMAGIHVVVIVVVQIALGRSYGRQRGAAGAGRGAPDHGAGAVRRRCFGSPMFCPILPTAAPGARVTPKLREYLILGAGVFIAVVPGVFLFPHYVGDPARARRHHARADRLRAAVHRRLAPGEKPRAGIGVSDALAVFGAVGGDQPDRLGADRRGGRCASPGRCRTSSRPCSISAGPTRCRPTASNSGANTGS